MENIIKGNVLFTINAAIGKEIAAIIDASETYLNTIKTISQTMSDMRNTLGISANVTPAVVATPFPPLNLKNTLQTWPEIAVAPIRT